MVNYPVFDAHATRKKSSYLVTEGLFDLHTDLATFMFTPPSFLLKDTTFVMVIGIHIFMVYHVVLKLSPRFLTYMLFISPASCYED